MLGRAWEVGEWLGLDEVVVATAEEGLAGAASVEMEGQGCEDLGEAVEGAGVGRRRRFCEARDWGGGWWEICHWATGV